MKTKQFSGFEFELLKRKLDNFIEKFFIIRSIYWRYLRCSFLIILQDYIKNGLNWSRILKPQEFFTFCSKILISYLTCYNTALLDTLRKFTKNSKYDFTLSMDNWKVNTKILTYIHTCSYEEICWKGNYEKAETDFLVKNLKEGDIFIDVGANVGLFTLPAAKIVGSTGKVIAFEPSRREFELLRKNLKLNKINNVAVFKVALSNYNGAAQLSIASGKYTGMNTLGSKFFMSNIKLHNIEKVPVKTLDDFFPKLGIEKITGIKIDTEGYDMYVLEGAKNIITKFKPFLIVELNENCLKDNGASIEALLSLIKSYDYDFFYFDDKDGNLTKKLPERVVANPFIGYNMCCLHKSKLKEYMNL